jgi:hypothetical protein
MSSAQAATAELNTTIVVLVIAFLLGGHGFWALSLCFTLIGPTLFVALLAHDSIRRGTGSRSIGLLVAGTVSPGALISPSTPVFLGVHTYGAGEALRLIFAITAVAVVALVAFVVASAPLQRR